LPVLAALLVLAGARPALAHKLSLFVVAEGKIIRGRAYLQGGGDAAGATVVLLDPQGRKLDQTTTDAQGRFQFEARRRCDYRVIVDSHDGHRAEETVRAASLPAELASLDQAAEPASPGHADSTQASSSPAVPAGSPADPLLVGEVRQLIFRVGNLAQQVEQLHESLVRQQATTRWRDVAGGIGYIVGLSGLAFYFLGVRRKERRGHAGAGTPVGK